MYKYTYINNSCYPIVKVVFECVAENILNADHLLFCELGIHAMKTRYLAVVVTRLSCINCETMCFVAKKNGICDNFVLTHTDNK